MLEWIGKRYMRMQENRHEGRGLSLQDEGGFTLIELLIVIIIIGILAAIAIPVFLSQRTKADIAACRSDTRNAAEAAVLVAANNDGKFLPVVPADFKTAARAEGWNQTTGVTTTFTPTVGGADINISSACPTGVTGTVTFSTTGADEGKVVGPTP